MKKLILITLMMMLIPLAFGLECQPVMSPSEASNCTITSLWNYGTCSNYHLVVYNSTGNITGNFTYYALPPYCQTRNNITTLGDYTGIVENGDTTSFQIQGDKKVMSFGVIIFMVIFNLVLFIFPFVVRQVSKNKATDYIIKHLILASAVLFFWLNVTILRTMAVNAGLGIDDLLTGLWWFSTLGVVIVIFTMIFTTTIGLMQMLKESEMKERMGENE